MARKWNVFKFRKQSPEPRRKWQKWVRRYKVKWILVGGMLISYIFCLPFPLFEDPTSTILLDRNEQLLGARIAADGQWRFPYTDSVPEKFKVAITQFEDKRFYYHPGIDPLAIGRAIRLNLSKGEIVSGGSTLSMQVIRLSRKGQGRTFGEKFLEMILATRLEFSYSKEEILALYAAHAPFGGNVVGLEAAAWKYFGRDAADLSWAEICTLAVLPNAPSLIHPGKNRDLLLRKRNFLLEKLCSNQLIDSTTLVLAKLEGLPGRPLSLPSYAPHLLEQIHQDHLKTSSRQTLTQSTLRADFQARANEIVRRHHLHLRQSGIHNAAALIVEVESGDVLAYVGNTPCVNNTHGCAVDIIPAHRSSGSILKPFLYASMLSDGKLLPKTLIPDVPSYYGGFSPTNYHRDYKGAVPANRALARSLNIPAVHMLAEYGVAKFYQELLGLGMTTLVRPSDEYGLTLVLGGAEASLWDLGGMYAGMARNLRFYHSYQGKYDPEGFRPLNYMRSRSRTQITYQEHSRLVEESPLSASALWHTFEAMLEVNRPDAESFWRNFGSAHTIAWKTGTSYGYRDAWAVGCTPEYVVAVWVGNADGEGRPGLVGTEAAAPVMFDLFDAINPSRTWFELPADDMAWESVCRQSGYRAGEDCPDLDSLWIPKAGVKTGLCPFHKRIHLDENGGFRVHGDCESPLNMRHEVFFVLPPSQEFHYRNNHPNYQPLPPYREDCAASLLANQQASNMEIVYPGLKARLFIPIDLDGSRSAVVFEAAHRSPSATIYWHLDSLYLGKTQQLHEMDISTDPGMHTITLVDQEGETIMREFEIMTKDEN